MTPEELDGGSCAGPRSGGAAELVRKVAAFYDAAPTESTWAARRYRRLIARYLGLWIPAEASVLEVGCGSGELLALLPNRDLTGIDVSEKQIEAARRRVPHGAFHVMAGEFLDLDRTFDAIILSETVNFGADVQAIFERLRSVAHPRTRLILNFHNNLWKPLLSLATLVGLRARHPQLNWFDPHDLENLLELAGWELIQCQPRILMALPAPLLGPLVNRWLAPLLPFLCVSNFMVARPERATLGPPRKVTIVIPVRNEAGNIEAAIRRLPRFEVPTEILFIEGHSRDDTFQEVLRIQQRYSSLEIRAMRQTGVGKGNAVREAFEAAQGDLLMILDGDLSMPPEELPKFYQALVSGKAELANGVRLIYPQEKRSMRFLNMCANKLFALLFSALLGQRLKDSLCGTKALFRQDHQRIAANRKFFGGFDPFGDFDLLLGASKLNLKIVDVPIRYQSRTYGSTNILRWRHGLLLWRMILLAARKLKFV